MKKILILIALCLISLSEIMAQSYNNTTDNGQFTADGYQDNRILRTSDSIQSQHKEVPRGLKVWTIDSRFGDKKAAEPDTVSYMFMNTNLSTGIHGEYNTLGNLGSPRYNRIFIDRQAPSEFFFIDPYDMFNIPVDKTHFTSTLSPITNLSYYSAGNRSNGQDHFRALFAANAGKEWGFGFKFDYLYGRGYYSNQNTSHFNYSMWGSYLGPRYNAYLLFALNHQKVSENGGIANDAYITHPEMFADSYSENEIPVTLQQNWNRNDNQHVFFNHRYSLGFYRKVPMTKEEIEARKFAIKSEQAQAEQRAKDKARRQALANGEEFDEEAYDKEHRPSGRPDDARIAGNVPSGQAAVGTPGGNGRIQVNMQDSTQMAQLKYPAGEQKDTTNQWMKSEYVPVTSFIHTVQFDNYRRIYQAYQTPSGYYLNNYYNYGTAANDTIRDRVRHWSLRNTFAIALLEGFNKWAKAGLKVFASHEIRHFEIPTYDASGAVSLLNGYHKFNQNNISIGAQLLKQSGKALHYNATGETWVTGPLAGQFHLDGQIDLNFPLLGDTAQLVASAFLHSDKPSVFYNEFTSKHFQWNNSFDKITHSRIMGVLAIKKTETKLRFAYDLLKNYTYFGIQNDRIASGNDYLIRNYNVTPLQKSSPIHVITAQLAQNLHAGIFHLDNVLTYQKSSNQEVLPVPTFNAYTNLYIRFKIARVLKCDFGADMRYFTSYYAPEYIPGLGSFGIQETDASRTKVGGYPLIDVYANFNLQHTRFFVMYSHINQGSSGDYLFVPHYPLNSRIFRFGISWTFFN